MTVAGKRAVRFMHHDASERPFIVIWEVTRACQLVCTHCRADAIRTRNPLELTTDEGRRLLDDLASFGPPRPLVVLTGGDPFERPDLPELVAHGTRIGLSMALSPSVTDRLTRPVLVELREAGANAARCPWTEPLPKAMTHSGVSRESLMPRWTLRAPFVKSAFACRSTPPSPEATSMSCHGCCSRYSTWERTCGASSSWYRPAGASTWNP